MNINELEVAAREQLKLGGFEFNQIDGIHIQFGVVPQYNEVVVVTDGPVVYRGLYDSVRGVCSALRKMEEPKRQMEVK